ncbi:MAG: pantoate--beta-alanine ligase [Legionella sp.]|nr:MAG: pantoate--beta-alanine ligase [Legionella sp.]
MQIIHSITQWRNIRNQISSDLSVGFVPTMGNLHSGHASLYELSRRDNDLSVASIFINPTQFNQIEDYQQYPKTLDDDLALLQNMGVDYCLLPDETSMYPDGYRYRIEETLHSLPLEGLKRPGHFHGVLTVVMMLFQLVKPHRAYFGEKDYQQYVLIRDMINAFFLDINITLCPTIREKSGLAYSSRNNRLSPAERQLAEQFAGLFHQNKSCAEISAALTQLGIKVDYIEEHDQRRFAAVYIGAIRLIDNYAISN